MARVIEGKLSGTGVRLAIVAARFNAFVVEPLIAGAIDALVRTGGSADDVTVVRCPGAYEIPQVLREVVAAGGHDAVVCLGAVIRGATPHFDYVAGEAAKGVAQVAAQAGIPVAFGILTTDTLEQAIDRAGAKAGNKGFDATMAALELVDLFRSIRAGAGADAAKPRRSKR